MRGNIAFNFASRLFMALSTFLCVPFYIAFLGREGYSVIALSLVVASVVLIFELGLSAAIGREMARRDITDAERRRSFVVIERLFMLIFLITIFAALFLADMIANTMIGETDIDRDMLAKCLSLILLEAGLQLLMRFYINVLMGLEHQIQANLFTIAWTALRNGFVIGVIYFTPSLLVFFSWQLVSTIAVVFALKLQSLQLIRAWPMSRARFFDIETLGRLRGFALGMVLISIVAVANTQVDRIMIGSLGSLNDLGVYTLAASLGSAILICSTPVMSAVLPRLTTYFTHGHVGDARALFRKATRLVAMIIIPTVVVFSSRSDAVLMAWIGEPDLARSAGRIVPWLVIGNASIGLATIGYAVALANGDTRINNVLGIMSLAISIPGYYLTLNNIGVVGVAVVFMTVQLVSTLLFSWFAMNRFLNGGFIRHHLGNYVVPLLGALVGHMMFQTLVGPLPEERAMILFFLAFELAFCGAVGAALSWGVWKLTDARYWNATSSA